MIQAVKRAIDILRCFEERETLGITEIAVKAGLNKSTAFGLVTTLTEEGLLEQERDTGRYRLGLELFRLGTCVNANVQRMVTPAIDALADQLKETVNFVRPDGGDVIYIIKKESPYSMRICTKTGQRLPMYCSAVGKAILAALPEEEADRIIGGFDFRAFTEFTITSPERLRADLRRIRRQGYAVDFEELEYELVCVAVPILDKSGRAVAAMSCSGPKSRMTGEKIEQARQMLRDYAGKLAGMIV